MAAEGVADLLRVSGFASPLRAVQLRSCVQDDELDAELLAVLELSKHDRGGDVAQRARLAIRTDSLFPTLIRW